MKKQSPVRITFSSRTGPPMSTIRRHGKKASFSQTSFQWLLLLMLCLKTPEISHAFFQIISFRFYVKAINLVINYFSFKSSDWVVNEYFQSYFTLKGYFQVQSFHLVVKLLSHDGICNNQKKCSTKCSNNSSESYQTSINN